MYIYIYIYTHIYIYIYIYIYITPAAAGRTGPGAASPWAAPEPRGPEALGVQDAPRVPRTLVQDPPRGPGPCTRAPRRDLKPLVPPGRPRTEPERLRAHSDVYLY